MDDLLVYVTNPITSTPEILVILQEFGNIPGFRLNLAKSEYFPITHNAGEDPNLPFKLSTESFTFLGVKVTKSYYSLFKSNLTLPLEQRKQYFKSWSILLLSLIGKANSVNLNFVPKFQYVFQELPVYIPQSFFQVM